MYVNPGNKITAYIPQIVWVGDFYSPDRDPEIKTLLSRQISLKKWDSELVQMFKV